LYVNKLIFNVHIAHIISLTLVGLVFVLRDVELFVCLFVFAAITIDYVCYCFMVEYMNF